ncbi:MAG: hydroxyethylthiazole kinase-like uncharacterized protein yjeF [Glaciecola sp.]|jgi:hydroxyethylthiazole kinase-like uncharacterized protein yjeF
MRRAAGHLARGVLEVTGGGYGRRVVIVVGKGNNGGDGWAAAPLLAKAGAQVTVVSLHDLDVLASPATSAARSAWQALPGSRVQVGIEQLVGVLAECDVVVDCMLGTGARGAPSGDVAQAVVLLNNCGRPIVACDVPTGVDADFGKVPAAAVHATLTVTFGALKRGLLLHPAAQHVGRLVVGDLGPRYPISASGWSALTAAGACESLPAVDAEKRSRGVALAIAGAQGTAGAAALCAKGLQAGGAGLVTVAVPQPIQATVAGMVPAAMTRSLPHELGVVGEEAVEVLADADRFDAVVAGPGMQPTNGTRAVIDHLRASAARLVLDADALNVYRDDPEVLGEHVGALVITPHERELARISGRHDVAEDRARIAVDLAGRLDCTVVAKGPRTVVAAADGRVWVTPVGGPGLATGGTGDVLAGLVAAAIATTDDVALAVARAVWLHGLSGDLAGRGRAKRLVADEFAHSIPSVLAQMGKIARTRAAWPFDHGNDPWDAL